MAQTAAERMRAYRDRRRQAKLATDDRRCIVCGGSMKGLRSDANVCSDQCRGRGWSQMRSLRYLAIDPEMNRFKARAEVEENEVEENEVEEGV